MPELSIASTTTASGMTSRSQRRLRFFDGGGASATGAGLRSVAVMPTPREEPA
jgi:hypothetical protein